MVPLPELQPKRCGLFSTPQIQCTPALAGSLVLRRLVLKSTNNFGQKCCQQFLRSGEKLPSSGVNFDPFAFFDVLWHMYNQARFGGCGLVP